MKLLWLVAEDVPLKGIRENVCVTKLGDVLNGGLDGFLHDSIHLMEWGSESQPAAWSFGTTNLRLVSASGVIAILGSLLGVESQGIVLRNGRRAKQK